MTDAYIYQATKVAYVAGYGLAFLLFGLFWLRVFFPGALRLRDRLLWPAITVGVLGMLLTYSLQPRIQTWANAQGVQLGWSVWAIGIVLVLISGIFQEALKAIGLAMSRFSSYNDIEWKPLGLAVGLGFGVWEAWQLVAAPLGLARLWSPVAVLERFSAIGLHIGLAAIIAYGFSERRPLRFAALAAILHAVANFSALLYQQWVIGFWATEAYIFTISLATVILANRLWTARRRY